MRDGFTRESRESLAGRITFADFLEDWSPSLVVLSGGLQGTDFPIERASTVVGRGPGVDLPPLSHR